MTRGICSPRLCSLPAERLAAAFRALQTMPDNPFRQEQEPANRRPITVLKFGGSSLRTDLGMDTVVSEIYREVRNGRRVLAVVSAFPGITDRLTRFVRRRFQDPHPPFLASLLATGETASAAFLGMALEEAGVPALVLDPDQAGLQVSGLPLDSDPAELDAEKIRRLFERYPVAVLPGFFGRSPSGSPALLGRGGSDLTALFAAHKLGAARCRLIKDVDGLYSADPKTAGGPVHRYSTASWDEAMKLGNRLIQKKALAFAQRHGLKFEISSALNGHSTVVGPDRGSPDSTAAAPRPLRVVLLGLGTVGLGVYRRMASHPARFELAGIGIRDSGKKRDALVPRAILTDDPWSLLACPADVVVELIGGLEPAASLIRASLEAGRHVVTANKAVIAAHGAELERRAASKGVELKYSASVCGSVPVLEELWEVTKHKEVLSISGVLNSTCNFVLDKLAEGYDVGRAVCAAQEAGLAEAEPHLDLSGKDSAHKLAILARAAFAVELDSSRIRRHGIEEIDAEWVRHEHASGRAVRLLGSCALTTEGLAAEVGPVSLSHDHPLHSVRGAENRVLIKLKHEGPLVLSGKGAGRRPTSLSIFADLLDLCLDPGRESRPALPASGHLGEYLGRCRPGL